jgi:hypothetical protein
MAVSTLHNVPCRACAAPVVDAAAQCPVCGYLPPAPPLPDVAVAPPEDELIALRWYNCPGGEVIGFVGLIDHRVGYFKVYIGTGKGRDTDADIRRIGRWGHPVLDEAMARVLIGRRPEFEGLRYEF